MSVVADRLATLDRYQEMVDQVILRRQHPISGLLPASTAITSHGNYTDAWVRDNVYSILAPWALTIAYRKLGYDGGKAWELQQSVVKLMRGLLVAMMRQAAKVEKFKQSQDPLDALHAKYDTSTGNPVVGDDEWGHLQIDATSIFLLILAQMTASGLQIIYTTDEVNFVQNLIYYIGRAYRTADYGIWERGNKINHGSPELNASSVGMAKAALEAINGLDLFGARGSQASVVHALEDEIARSRATLESLLPRESASKEVDAALLSVIGFPAFAVERRELVDRTREQIVSKLAGRYGCKRFLRDGHQTAIEDTNRLHYEPYELEKFAHIECEWPLFWTYLLLDALFRGDRATAEDYQAKLLSVSIEREGVALLPEVYWVPEWAIGAERANPGSQNRQPNENVPLVWAQSLWIVGQLLLDDLIQPGDIDPLGQRLRLGSLREPVVQIALLAEDEDLKAQLGLYGIDAPTPADTAPIEIRHARDLSLAYAQIGRNDKLGLSGRPIRRLRSLSTSRIFEIRGRLMVFLPSYLDPEQFYLSLDPEFLASQIRGELNYIARHWQKLGRPTVTLLLTRAMLGVAADPADDRPDAAAEQTAQEAAAHRLPQIDPQSPLLNLIAEFKTGRSGRAPVRLGYLRDFLLTAGRERIDFLHNFQFPTQTIADAVPRNRPHLVFDPTATRPLNLIQEVQLESATDPAELLDRLRASRNLYEQVELVQDLVRLKDLHFDTGWGQSGQRVTLADLAQELYQTAARGQIEPDRDGIDRGRPYWGILRRAAAIQAKADVSLSDAVTDLLVRQKTIAVGRAYSDDAIIQQPMSHQEIVEKINHFCGEDARDRVLTQEILIDLGMLIKSNPNAFKGFLLLRTGNFILLLVSELARELLLEPADAYERLMELSPFEIQTRLREVIEGYPDATQALQVQESIRLQGADRAIEWTLAPRRDQGLPPAGSWLRQRELDGTINRVPKDFYPKVWDLLGHCKGLVIGDKLERRNRLESALLRSEMTPGEKNFALQVEHLLDKIGAPLYRQVCLEALLELAELSDRNPDLWIDGYIVLDVLIGHAVRLAWLDRHPDKSDRYNEFKSQAWQQFYETSPYDGAAYIVKAVQFLAHVDESIGHDEPSHNQPGRSAIDNPTPNQ